VGDRNISQFATCTLLLNLIRESSINYLLVPALLDKNIRVMDVTARQCSTGQNSVHTHYARVAARVVQKSIHISIGWGYFDVRIDYIVVFRDEFVEQRWWCRACVPRRWRTALTAKYVNACIINTINRKHSRDTRA
jgi:hypothetical protein